MTAVLFQSHEASAAAVSHMLRAPVPACALVQLRATRQCPSPSARGETFTAVERYLQAASLQ
ncbi:hypothetical protein EDC30_104320 [Paucimonas lemoignei]|uniref:Uncharacterized protein n=1 Tax=Paucimonas lemoignei TaxID=29443 RepID=A0A4R3HW63_PAULE|nr:hypothetical protein EDC30_104320 [Paucimonas lemoignei]